MTKNKVWELRLGDRVLFDHGRYGLEEGIVEEIAAQGGYVKLSYTSFGESSDWVDHKKILTRLTQLRPLKKKGWFR